MNENPRLNAYLEAFLHQDKWKQQAEALPLFQNWRTLAGDLAVHCHPRDLENNILVVETDHPGWMQLFQFREQEILQKIRKKWPQLKIKAFRYRLLTPDQPATPEKNVERRPEIEEREPEIPAVNSDDPALKDILKKLEP